MNNEWTTRHRQLTLQTWGCTDCVSIQFDDHIHIVQKRFSQSVLLERAEGAALEGEAVDGSSKGKWCLWHWLHVESHATVGRRHRILSYGHTRLRPLHLPMTTVNVGDLNYEKKTEKVNLSFSTQKQHL